MKQWEEYEPQPVDQSVLAGQFLPPISGARFALPRSKDVQIYWEDRTMKKAEIKVGSYYVAKVSGSLTVVLIKAAPVTGGWIADNERTGCMVRIRSAQRLRRELTKEQYLSWVSADVKRLIRKQMEVA